MMEEMANKVLDLLREEGMSIWKARMTLERAIKLLENEKLGPKNEK